MDRCKASRTRYEKRIQAVEDYIHAHLDESIDLNRLADIACLSPYHWHRVYRALQGETVHSTVSRLCLQQAARLLVSSELSLVQVARRAGYSALPSFSRAFKSAYGSSPGQYRNSGPHTIYQSNLSEGGVGDLCVVVRDQPDYQCVAVSHTGSYSAVDRAFSTLFRKLSTPGSMTEAVQMIGVYFDDPAMLDESKLESLACAAGVSPAMQPHDLDTWHIQGGMHAVLRHHGSYDGLDSAYDWLFGQWLPNSGHDPQDQPVYEVYVNDPRETAPKDLLVEICLPLIA